MQLSIIIVSYNVRYFLEQCLASVRQAIRGPLRGDVEVIIVDNASTDGTLHFLRPLFPVFSFIANPENTGFARANNAGLARAVGQFVLFLNPDTLLPEDGLQHALAFMTGHPRAGAAGFHMIDGRGRFLRESKRGFPGAAASFYKMTGLAAAFPRSGKLAAYYAGNVAEHTSAAVDILSGAAMLVRKTVLDETGGFDERFFMYAEDIDLSWRVRQTGFQNHYLADITILHFKGESTRRDLKYVRLFYKAMHQFRDKYGRKKNGVAEWLLRAGIGIREAVAMSGVFAARGHSMPGRTKEDKLRGIPRSKTGYGSLTTVSGNRDYVLLGQPADPAVIQKNLAAAGLSEAGQATPGCTLIFCESPGLSWKNIISAIAGETPDRQCLIHGYETHALVGSPASDRQGQVIFLNG